MKKTEEQNGKEGKTKRRKRLEGVVVKKAGEKTTVVKVVTLDRHPKYLKKVVKSKKYLVHDLEGRGAGEQVIIEETRPLSRRKRWKMVTGDSGSKA